MRITDIFDAVRDGTYSERRNLFGFPEVLYR